jgi:hypothetical protein
MDRSSYEAAVASDRPRVALTGVVPPTPWDPPLQDAMNANGVAVFEEELRFGLVDATTEEGERRTADQEPSETRGVSEG